MFSFKKKKSIIVKAVMCLCAICMLCSCDVNIKPISLTEEEAKEVGTVGSYTITFDELRYVTLNCKADMIAQYGEDIFTDEAKKTEYSEKLRERVYEILASDYYALKAMADEYYLGGSEAMFNETEIVEKVSSVVNETAEGCGGKKEYLATLKENFMTDRLFRFYTTCNECATELIYILKNDLGLIANTTEKINELLFSDKFIRTNHVFISGRSEESLALANQVRDQLLASAKPEYDIIYLKGKYDADFTLTTTHGKYFGRYNTDYGDAYEEAAFALPVGGISEVVEGTDGSSDYIQGYFVILRLEPEKDYITANSEDFGDDIIGSEFNVMLNEFKKKLTFTPNEYCQALDLLSIE